MREVGEVEEKLLDHGYVKLVECWGTEEGIVEAARMSTQKGFRGWGTAEEPGDERLLAYLWRNGHTSPFEMAGAIIEVQAPIFVFREWHRHRTQSYNEASSRYEPLPDVNYLPSEERLEGDPSTSNRQAQSTALFDKEAAAQWRLRVEALYREIESVYRDGLSAGVPKEVARVVVPVGRYSKMRASANLLNWLKFMKLRCDGAAQWEIRQYACALAKIMGSHFPRVMHLAGLP